MAATTDTPAFDNAGPAAVSEPDERVTELAGLFGRLGRRLSAMREISEVYHALTSMAVAEVPGAEFAGITQGRKGVFRTIAPSDELVRKVDQIQYELRSGPCVDAALDDSVYDAPDLRADQRWPEFGSRAFESTGVISMLSFRMFFEDDADLVAAINMYSTRRAAFEDTSRSAGLLLSTHGALALAAAEAHDKADNLLQALSTSREIGIAMGVLMARHKITRDQAFDLLRIASQHTHRKVSSIALDVVETGELPVSMHSLTMLPFPPPQ